MKNPDFTKTGRTRSMGTVSTITQTVVALGPQRSLRFSCQHIPDAHDEWRMRPKRLSRSSSVPFWHSFVFFLADSLARSFGSPHNVHTKAPIYSLDTPLAFVWTPFSSCYYLHRLEISNFPRVHRQCRSLEQFLTLEDSSMMIDKGIETKIIHESNILHSPYFVPSIYTPLGGA